MEEKYDKTVSLLNDEEKKQAVEKDGLVDKMRDQNNEQNKRAMKRLVFATSVSLFFIVVQTAGAIVSGSIAIFADTAHLLSDIIGFAISIACLFAA